MGRLPQHLDGAFRKFIEAIPIAMLVFRLEPAGRLVFWGGNWATDRLLMVDHRKLVGQGLDAAFPTLVQRGLGPALSDVAARGMDLRTDVIRFDRAGPMAVACEVHAFQPFAGVVAVALIDVTEREHREQALRKLSQAVEQSPTVVMITDPQGVVEYVNPRFVEITDYAAEEAIGRDWAFTFAPSEEGTPAETILAAVRAGQEWRGELHARKKSGDLFWEFASVSPIKSAEGVITHFVAVKEDISLRKDYEAKLVRQANYDDLTGLPNRLLAFDRLSQAIGRADRNKGFVALAFVDLDDFKKVNDTLGHATGDQLLIEAARRLRGCIRSGDTVGRLGGDEFLFVFPDLPSAQDAPRIAAKLLQAFQDPFLLGGHSIVMTASAGFSLFPNDGGDPMTLLRHADIAMYQAKRGGGGGFAFFAREMNEQAVRRLTIETHLNAALARSELHVVLQPLVSLADMRLTAVEALLRWDNPVLGTVGPDAFIPVAEQSGLIKELGAFVLSTVCRTLAHWRESALPVVRMAVNVSARQFRDSGFPAEVLQHKTAYGLEEGQIELEITERLLLDDRAETREQLAALRRSGIRLAIDDFGTGYSALNYLRRFPVDTLKIDRSFIRGITTDRSSAALVRAITAMAHSLDMEVVAEGVETPEELAFLMENGCDFAQGFLIARPVPIAGFADLYQAWHSGGLRRLEAPPAPEQACPRIGKCAD